MSTDRDDRWGDDNDEFDPKPAPDTSAAAEKVRAPGLLMILCGLMMLGLTLLGVAVTLSGYDLTVAMLEKMEEMQPAGQAKEDFKKEVEKAKVRDRTAEYAQNIIFSIVGLALDLVVLISGIRMRQLKSHSLAIVGSIIAILPINSCCCITMFVGIWSLIVLLKPDVKAAFAANRRLR